MLSPFPARIASFLPCPTGCGGTGAGCAPAAGLLNGGRNVVTGGSVTELDGPWEEFRKRL